MNTAKVERFYNSTNQALGVITACKGTQIFIAKTLERGWLNNEPNISCIPAGRYDVVWTRSNRLSELKGTDVFTYEVLNVINRSGIRIHSANYFYQLNGCIALGSAHKELNRDMELDLVHSGETVRMFADFMERRPFIIEVVDLF